MFDAVRAEASEPEEEDPPKGPVTLALAAASVLATAAWWLGADMQLWFSDGRVFGGEVWRFGTAALLHVDVLHIAFNLFFMLRIGSSLERRVGAGRYLGIAFALAVASTLAQIPASGGGGVGLSGILYGIWALFEVAGRRDPRWSGVVNADTTRWLVGWFFLCVALTWADMMRVGNAAHLGGAVAGAALGLGLTAPSLRVPLAAAAGAALIALAGAGVLVSDPPARLRAIDASSKAAAAWERQDYATAIPDLERALELDPTFADAARLLAYAYLDQAEPGKARDWYQRAYDIDGVTDDLVMVAYAALAEGDAEAALAAFDQALVVQQDVHAWAGRGSALEALGRREEAIEAYDRALQLDPYNDAAFDARQAIVQRVDAEAAEEATEEAELAGAEEATDQAQPPGDAEAAR